MRQLTPEEGGEGAQGVRELVQAMDVPDVRGGTNEAAAIDLRRIVNEEDRLAQ